MNKRLLYLPRPVDFAAFKKGCDCVFGHLRPVCAQLWPDFCDWVIGVAPDIFGSQIPKVRHLYTLDENTLSRTLIPELSEVYLIESGAAFARVLYASIFHSELSSIFFPASLSRSQVRNLCIFMDQYEVLFSETPEARFDAPWAIAVGVAANESDSLLLVADSAMLVQKLEACLLKGPQGLGAFLLWAGREQG